MKSLELEKLDLQFCADCEKNGVDAWISYFDKNGIMATSKHDNNIVGTKAIYSAMKSLFDLPDLLFAWSPDYSEISQDNTMGVTMGKYTRTFTHKGETIIQKGKYTTIWKKIHNEWKVVLDIGN